MATQRIQDIKRIIIHCAATPPDMCIGADTIDKWHKENGWGGIGYHYVIRRNGNVEIGRLLTQVGVHTSGKNTNSIGICLIGGIDKKGKPEDNFTDVQYEKLEYLIEELREQMPMASIHGHNEFAAKACPSFDVSEWLKEVGIPKFTVN